ncbi:MAG: DNA adenine methylase [Promethearchaeota archaeon]
MNLDKFLGIETFPIEDYSLPKRIEKVRVPPIKCQGIKTKLVNFISLNLKWNGEGIWYEPFMGSGVVSFNIKPKKAILSDINPHIINFYKSIQNNKINPKKVREFLNKHGKKLALTGKSTDSYYYEMRDKFNETNDPMYFLFLNRSCFNGLIRFNSSGKFNTPFCRKPNRFSKSYITKIVNQVAWIYETLRTREFDFQCIDWKDAVSDLKENDLVYIDPPYYGRHTTYYNEWSDDDMIELVEWTRNTKSGFAISLWLENKYRKNPFIEKYWSDNIIRTFSHYYFIGSTENNRTKMEEALIISPKNASEFIPTVNEPFKNYQG